MVVAVVEGGDMTGSSANSDSAPVVVTADVDDPVDVSTTAECSDFDAATAVDESLLVSFGRSTGLPSDVPTASPSADSGVSSDGAECPAAVSASAECAPPLLLMVTPGATSLVEAVVPDVFSSDVPDEGDEPVEVEFSADSDVGTVGDEAAPAPADAGLPVTLPAAALPDDSLVLDADDSEDAPEGVSAPATP